MVLTDQMLNYKKQCYNKESQKVPNASNSSKKGSNVSKSSKALPVDKLDTNGNRFISCRNWGVSRNIFSSLVIGGGESYLPF